MPANGHAEVRVSHRRHPLIKSFATGIQVIAPSSYIRECMLKFAPDRRWPFPVTRDPAGFLQTSRPRDPSGTAPAVDESPGRLPGGGVAARHHVGVAALLEVWIEDRLPRSSPA